EFTKWQYIYGNNTKILYVIKQKIKKDKKLYSLIKLFALENNDSTRMELVEKILISLTDAANIKQKGNFINSQYLFVLESLDKQELISFSKKSSWHVYSEVELADIVNKEFENLKIEMYTKLMQQIYCEKYFKIENSDFNVNIQSEENENSFFI
ncbi:MAG: hypothetical protein LUH05_09190, partial [Candidatus Gastranaerophilales bacterium]|nr:hypothetical protein [Candidatus Gastranaerophilales bacterium]